MDISNIYSPRLVFERIFNNSANKINVSSTKSQTGHLLGAAGSVEAIYSIKSIIEGILPYTVNLDNPIPASNINEAMLIAEKLENYIVNTSIGSWKNKVIP